MSTQIKELVECINNSINHNHTWNLFNILQSIEFDCANAKIQCVAGFFPIYTKRPASVNTIRKRCTAKELMMQVNGIQYRDNVIYIVC